MTVSRSTPKKPAISLEGYLLAAVWAAALLAIVLVGGYMIISSGYANKQASIARHQARIDPHAAESGKTEAEKSPPPGHENDTPVEVQVGLYIDRIVELSVKETGWTVDFYIWFNWTGSALNPGETFQVVDGQIESREKLKETTTGDQHYTLYRVTARITKFFDVSRFPADDHLLTINIEDTASQSYQLHYVPDPRGSAVSSRVKTPGYQIYQTATVVKPHSYKTPRGDPGLPPDFKATYSQFIYGIGLSRPDLGFYLKLFQGLYAAVFIALLVFFIKPSNVDPRFGLSVGAFFAAIANTYIAASLLPDTGVLTLTDMVNGLGLVTIFLTIVQSTLSLYLYENGHEPLSGLLDKVSFVVLLIGYVIINVVVPLTATL